MAKIKILGNSFTITSGIAAETLRKVKRYYPDALQLKDSNSKAVVFEIKTDRNTAAFGNSGVHYNSVNAAGYPYATFDIPADLPQDKKTDFVKDIVGTAIIKLNELEELINNFVTTTFATTIVQIEDSIEVIED